MPLPPFRGASPAASAGRGPLALGLPLRRLLLAALLLACALSARAQTAADPEDSPGPLRTVAPVSARKALVVAAHPLAAAAGVEVLRAGGNAVDAAAAAAFALNVVEPQSSGIGGGLFLLLYRAEGGQVVAIDGREEAPASATPGMFLRSDGKPEPFYPDRITGGKPVGVPGHVKALAKALVNFGRLGLARVLSPAIRLAEEGFPVSPRLARQLERQRERLLRFPATRAVFFPNGADPVAAGAVLRQPDLARTLRRLAEHGAEDFYRGEIAKDILHAVNQAPVNPGALRAEDLADYDAPLRAPVQGSYRGYAVYGMGPPSSGAVTVLQMLALLESRPRPDGPSARIHRFAQAARLAYADRERYLADGDFVPVPVAGLLDAGYLAGRSLSLDWGAPLGPVAAGRPPGAAAQAWAPPWDTESDSTTHLSVVDEERNAVALTASIEQAFGSGMVVPGRGFLLNNELTDFSALPADAAGRPTANRVEGGHRPRAGALDGPARPGGKRPRSSMAPTLVLRNGRPVLVIGSPGGPRIIQFVAAVLEGVLGEGLPLQAAINAPHATHLGGTTTLEPEWAGAATQAALRKLGHIVQVERQASGLHGIQIDPDGTLRAGVDPRREGHAAGY